MSTIEHLTPSTGPLGSWPCIGRARVVGRVVAAMGQKRNGVVLLRGPLGVGKTRATDEAIVSLRAAGRTVQRVVATSATSAVPFGALAHLLPLGARDVGDPLTIIGAVHDVLRPTDGVRTVLVIDDVPLLDLATAGVVASLVNSESVDVIATARSDEPLPEPLVDALLGGHAVSAELDALDDDDVDTLLHLALGGPVDGAAVLSLRDRSAGNPLFLRELTRSAIDSGALAEVGGVWRLRSELPGSTRLREVVEARLDLVAADTRPALELLALCEPVSVDELESMVGLEALADLEARSLLRVDLRQSRQLARLGHPLHGEAIRMSLPPLRVRLLMRAHVQWVEANTLPADRDELQLALWRLDAGLPADLDSLTRGAELAAAAHDSRSAIRLAEPVFAQRPSGEVAWVLVDALFQSGDWAAAYDYSDRASSLPARSSVRVDLVSARATILLWGAGQGDQALATLSAMLDEPDMTEVDRARLVAQIGSVLVNIGRPGEAIAALADAAVSSDMQTRLGAAVSYTTALALAGRTQEALTTIDRSIAERPADTVRGVAAADTFLVARAFALAEAGRLQEAVELGERSYEQAVLAGRTLSEFWFALGIGRCHLSRGAPQSALRWFTRARALGLDVGIPGPVRSALVGVVMSNSLLGNREAALAASAEMETLPPFGFIAPEALLAHGWAAVVAGDFPQARLLFSDVDDAVDTAHVTSAIWLLHEAARLGADVAARITELADTTDSPLSRSRAEHARALVARDRHALVAVADRFEQMGANLVAAEALNSAVDLARSAGDQRAATALAGRAQRVLERCEGAMSPASVSVQDAVDPLTAREREIAFLAAGGMASREIAERLYLSFRTVNNHLQHVYDKLGIRTRTELRDAMHLDATGGR